MKPKSSEENSKTAYVAHHYYHISNYFPRIAEERRSGVVVFIVRTFAGETLHSVEFWLNIIYEYYTWIDNLSWEHFLSTLAHSSAMNQSYVTDE